MGDQGVNSLIGTTGRDQSRQKNPWWSVRGRSNILWNYFPIMSQFCIANTVPFVFRVDVLTQYYICGCVPTFCPQPQVCNSVHLLNSGGSHKGKSLTSPANLVLLASRPMVSGAPSRFKDTPKRTVHSAARCLCLAVAAILRGVRQRHLTPPHTNGFSTT